MSEYYLQLTLQPESLHIQGLIDGPTQTFTTDECCVGIDPHRQTSRVLFSNIIAIQYWLYNIPTALNPTNSRTVERLEILILRIFCLTSSTEMALSFNNVTVKTIGVTIRWAGRYSKLVEID